MKDDVVILTIRKIKNKFGIATNNRLYVSPENYEAYKKKRSKFEQKVVLLGAFGMLISIFVIGANLLLRGAFDIVQVLSSIALTLFLVALGFVDYVPAAEDLQEAKEKPIAQETKRAEEKSAGVSAAAVVIRPAAKPTSKPAVKQSEPLQSKSKPSQKSKGRR